MPTSSRPAPFPRQLVVQHPSLAGAAVDAIAHELGGGYRQAIALGVARFTATVPVDRSAEAAADAAIDRPPGAPSAAEIAERHGVDAAWVPDGQPLSDFRLIAFDMDSTLITIECVDEIADYAGKKAEVAAITEAAMRGEIRDYDESLRRRVALQAGLPESVLQRVYDERLRLTPGAETLTAAARRAGLKLLLVSGGFTFFTERLKPRLGLDFTRANVLEVRDGRLTGEVRGEAGGLWSGEIVNAGIKRRTVEQACAAIGCRPGQAIVVGDGANDLEMMAIAGLSVAFHAKPVVRARTTRAINHGGLDAILAWFADGRERNGA